MLLAYHFEAVYILQMAKNGYFGLKLKNACFQSIKNGIRITQIFKWDEIQVIWIKICMKLQITQN